MKRTNIIRASVDQLVEQFKEIALAQDQALLMGEIAKFNRLYDHMELVSAELKQREGDQRRRLIALYRHPNLQVRLKAAIHTLAIDPSLAREQLEAIRQSGEQPQALDAGMSIRNLDLGIFKPT